MESALVFAWQLQLQLLLLLLDFVLANMFSGSTL